MVARDLIIGLIVGGGAIGGLFLLQPFHKTTPIDGLITFSDYNFYDTKAVGGAFIQINASLPMPDNAKSLRDRQLANNTYTIRCLQDEMKCHVAENEQIGDNQVDEITMTDFTVTVWQPGVVLATDYNDDDTITCVKHIISIDRYMRKAIYVTEPVNIAQPTCSKATVTTTKQEMGSSEVWSWLHSDLKV